ncbi:maltose ABC transporter permease MalF [Pseudoruegeria sp. SHC-113]|uniref:maltose ABC transporter permease MalF n=1 Tax=Pseudoruegeria sp. SHC-113 TaxID=2855439 RepID=UPI0021BBB4E1|nr:maltose ABC transporter permease MalF [Pseudoruegeria sp. SHC-113]
MSDTVSAAPMTGARFGRLIRFAGLGAIAVAFLYVIWGLYMAAQPVYAVLTFALGAAIVILYGWSRFYTWRFVFPGVAAVAVFIVLPVIYTSAIGFTNFSATNLLTLDRVQAYHLQTLVKEEGSKRPFALTTEGEIYFPAEGDRPALITPPLGAAEPLLAEPALVAPETEALKAVMANRDALQAASVQTPDGQILTMDGLRAFSASAPFYTLLPDGVLVGADGTRLIPNQEIGFYETEEGEKVTPGWRVPVGWDNFRDIAQNEGIREPIFQIFVWTFTFAFLSMLLTFSVGTGLAVILEWPHLKGAAIYRVLLVLPYAVPAFISILVFRGLFNQNFGEINLILSQLFGIKPDWFTDPALARSMLLIVNTWLGYPYWMLLIAGYLQAVPKDHYKAAALEGAGPVRCFFSITLPQILPPSVPLLIANFAFNFNNIVLVLLLTRGGPDIPGTLLPAGSTDLLGSFTYQMAFNDSGQNFGMAGAISTLIFAVTGIIAYTNFRVMQKLAAKRSAR